jgi:hypothetical protein
VMKGVVTNYGVQIAVFTHGQPIVAFGTLLHKTSSSRRPTKARQNIYRASIATTPPPTQMSFSSTVHLEFDGKLSKSDRVNSSCGMGSYVRLNTS